MSAEHFTARRQEERRKKSLTQGNRKSFSGFSTAGKEEKNVWIAVEDNGRGFPEDFDLDHNEARKETKSFGLFSIRERLEPIDGTLKIVSIPGKGATVAMSCPLKLKEGEFK